MSLPGCKTALITGASSGIGEAFARHLSASGYHIILVARRKERMLELASELERQYAVPVEVLAADLTQDLDIQQVEDHIRQMDSLDLLVNNAGFGLPGYFSKLELEKHLNMIQVHIIASVRFTHAALPGMIARQQGGIINVSSVAAYLPWGSVNYCATKAYLVAFSEALNVELRPKNVRVQALCPGFTITEFHDQPELAPIRKYPLPRSLWLSSDFVVKESMLALARNRVICIPGLIYRIAASLGRIGLVSPLFRMAASRVRRS